MKCRQKNKFPNHKVLAIASGVMAALATLQSSAQEVADQTVEMEEVVVTATGTLIRGVQPVGSQTLSVDEAAIEDLAPATMNELLGTLPQVSNFFNNRPEQDPRGVGRNTINRPNLRNLPGINSASGATTLILVDGHRMGPVGVEQSSFDPDMLPAIVMQGVEIVTDGGSSIYGADAVGGVINFKTRDEFDGVRVDLGYDFGDEYSSSNVAVMAGTKWQGGSGYLALAHSERDQLRNRDVSWGKDGIWSEDGSTLSPADVQCRQAVGSQTTYVYLPSFVNPQIPPPGVWTDNAAVGGGTQSLGAPCDNSGFGSYLPEQDRDWLYGGITQDLSDRLSLNVKAYYSQRELTATSDPRGGTVSDPEPSGEGAPFQQYIQNQLSFSYAANSGYVEAPRVIDIDVWGVTPEFTYELNNDWRLLTTFHYSMSNSKSTGSGVNQLLQNESIANGSLNPANVAAADPALVASILDQYDVKDTEQEMFYGRVIADGPLFTLPAGEVRVAVGAQYTDQSAELLAGDFTSTDRSGLQTRSNDRDITSVFAEVSVPVVESLTLSLSARYDDYSDFGDTTNPNVGFSWMPVEWLEIFGHWGESFNAPTPIDPLLPGFIRGYFPFAAFIVPDGGQRDPSRLDVLLAEGAGGALQPQTAEIWSLGFNMQPVDGLRINMNYFDIEFNDLLGSVNPQSAVAVQQNPDKFIFNPTQAQVDEFLSQMANGDQYAGLPAGPIGVLVDRRIGNTDQALLEGLDFGIEYSHQTSFGQMSYGLSGTKQLDFVTISNGNASDVLKYDTSDLNLVASVGWAREGMRGNLRVKYSAGFDSNPATGAANQTSVDDFVVADLHLALDVDDSLTFSVNVENLLDEEPPEWRLNQQPAYGFWTLGRVVKVGISKTF